MQWFDQGAAGQELLGKQSLRGAGSRQAGRGNGPEGAPRLPGPEGLQGKQAARGLEEEGFAAVGGPLSPGSCRQAR